MKRFPVQVFSSLCLVLSLAISPELPAQAPAQNTGPIPSQILSAHTIFLANTGADPNFPIDSTRAYNDIYAALKAWGHYRLVGAPSDADLVFQLHDLDPITDVTGNRGGVYTLTSPAFQLTILDPKTNIVLWTIVSPVTLAGRKKTFDRWVTLSENNLVSRIEVLSGQPLSAAQTADLTTVPNYHRRRNTLIIVGAVVAAGAASALILHHEFDNSVNNQKAQQDAFCEANNIPLSMCAGG